MSDPSLPATQPSFEELKRLNDHDAEYWSARDLHSLLGFSQWRRFEDAGYKGLYGGRGNEAIKAHKGIAPREQLMDRMNATELAANQFRMTQARDKLDRDNVRTQQRAIDTHHAVGKEVRDAIARIGGTLPEDIPPAEHIKAVEKRIKTATPKLNLDQRDASGLLGGPGDEGEQ